MKIDHVRCDDVALMKRLETPLLYEPAEGHLRS